MVAFAVSLVDLMVLVLGQPFMGRELGSPMSLQNWSTGSFFLKVCAFGGPLELLSCCLISVAMSSNSTDSSFFSLLLYTIF